MGDFHVKYLLIGGGVASFSAAAAIRQRDKQGELLLVGQEINRPYNRVPLSKSFLRRQSGRADLFTCPPDWFAKNGVQLRTGCRAAHLDAARSVVTLENGEAISFDRLLLATGCVPRPLGIAGQRLPNVYVPRIIEDYEQLLTAAGKARAEGHRHARGSSAAAAAGAGSSAAAGTGRGVAAVIGAGLLGVEIASSLTQSGLEVDLIAAGPHPWSHFAGEDTGRFLSRLLADNGVRLHLSQRAQRIEGDGRAQRVVLTDGNTLTCDFVVVAAGTMVGKELLRGTGIISENAILADEHCRTNVAGIFAAGDCAAVRDPIFGKHRAPEGWDTAAATGAVAGENMAGVNIAGVNMAGGGAALQAVASFTTEAFGVTAQAWGQSKHIHRRLLRGAAAAESAGFVEIGIAADGRIAQILAVANARAAARLSAPNSDASVFESLIRRRFPVDGREDALRDPAFPLEELLT
jgi:3-phenylpropionate/trans-cinnamate dioxygenase ferredoxin reductase component